MFPAICKKKHIKINAQEKMFNICCLFWKKKRTEAMFISVKNITYLSYQIFYSLLKRGLKSN